MPGLQGRRIELRPLNEPEAEILYAAIEASRDKLKRRLRWVSSMMSIDKCRVFLRAAQSEADAGTGFVYGIFEKKKRNFIGLVALQGLQRIPGLAEFSGWMRSDQQDKGYAPEAGRIVLGQAFKKHGLHKLFARIDPTNRSARKVLQKLGFRYEGCLRHEKRLNGRWIDQECWGVLQSEWKQ